MDEWARSRITEWDDAPFDGGVDGLHDLADAGFTGAVQAGSTWVLMLNGRVVGRSGGELASVGPTGTAYHAPDPSLPLLFAMLDRGGEEEGQYYTEQTSLTSVHDSLEDGGFVGYMLLSEHVLSGDYYVVYYGDQALPVAFIGASERLVTGEDAFELAADEVGIYEVRSVDLDVEELAPRSSPADSSAEGAAGSVVDTAEEEQDEVPEDAVESPTDVTSESPTDATGDVATEADAAASAEVADEPEVQSALPGTDADRPADADAEPAGTESIVSTEGRVEGDEDEDIDTSSESPPPEPTTAADDETAKDGEEVTDGTAVTGAADQPDAQPAGIAITSEAGDRNLDDQLAGLEHERDALLERIDELEVTREDLEAELASLAEEHRSLQAVVESLEAEVATNESTPVDESPPDVSEQSVPVPEALSQTHLFVRYNSNDAATLRAVGAEEVPPEAVLDNLVVEGHTEFDADAVTIDGQPFDRFLDERLELRVARWLVEGLPFKLADSSAREGLAGLLEAVRNLDRIDFNTTIDGVEDHRFDVVGRNRLGAPLLVAEVDGGRHATTVESIRGLLDGATEVSKHADEFAGALLVTGSYFDPGVIEAADEATSSGLLSRSDRSSYVHVSRGVGYHLCLGEYRSDAAHVTKPAL